MLTSNYIFTEGRTDAAIIDLLLSRLFPNHSFIVQPVNGSLHPSRVRATLARSGIEEIGGIAVYDQDEGAIGDILTLARIDHVADVVYCPAVPTTEAWLLADVDWAAQTFNMSVNDLLRGQRYGNPNYWTAASNEVKKMFWQQTEVFQRAFSQYSVERAAAMSPSLRYFVDRIRQQADKQAPLLDSSEVLSVRLDRNIIASLIAEVRPPNSALHKTLGKTYTAAEMRNEVINGTKVGVGYIANVLRVARDILRFEAEGTDGGVDE